VIFVSTLGSIPRVGKEQQFQEMNMTFPEFDMTHRAMKIDLRKGLFTSASDWQEWIILRAMPQKLTSRKRPC
jgi:hypothetical protein